MVFLGPSALMEVGGPATTVECYGPLQWLKNRPEHAESSLPQSWLLSAKCICHIHLKQEPACRQGSLFSLEQKYYICPQNCL